MTPLPYDVDGRHVIVVGGGRSGLAASRLVVGRGGRVTLIDAKPELAERGELEAIGVELQLGSMPADVPQGADLVVVSPGVPADAAPLEAARARGVTVIGELEYAASHLAGPVIAITGSKGKSTTTTLVGRMIEASGQPVLVGGNIGVPLSAQVEAATRETWHVVETSSFQLETIVRFHPRVAAWLNFSPDHLDRHVTEDAYERAKARIFENQTLDDWALVPADDAKLRAHAASGRARVVTFGATDRNASTEGVAIEGDVIAHHDGHGGGEPLVPVSAVRLMGRHMLGNVMAACAMAHLAGVSGPDMTRAVEGFTGLEHALEYVATVGGVRVYNDSKATNVEAATRAVEAFDGPVSAIVGGVYKGGDFALLGPPLQARGGTVVAIGEAAALVEGALAPFVPVTRASSMEDAVGQALAQRRGDGVMVLAPACASFDMFRDYADRGRVFKAIVTRLAGAPDGGEVRNG
ncbi:MAG TPA: UDP-N-acetylmuramoyl-L-alanine--D-glutamate ligase [Luteitalea sp.]|nr:UDP-N-acetylmuramoyl-L-alanine--D-glutamate ligase [Luteitalea sp.]